MNVNVTVCVTALVFFLPTHTSLTRMVFIICNTLNGLGYNMKNHRFETRAIHAGQQPCPSTGAVMTPIYATSTYKQSAPGVHQGFEYSRTHNPTRFAYEDCVASLESGHKGYA